MGLFFEILPAWQQTPQSVYPLRATPDPLRHDWTRLREASWTWLRHAKPLGEAWWAHKGSNLGPLPCEGNALPLSYAPGTIMQGGRTLSAGRRIGARDLEVRA